MLSICWIRQPNNIIEEVGLANRRGWAVCAVRIVSWFACSVQPMVQQYATTAVKNLRFWLLRVAAYCHANVDQSLLMAIM